jgi:L-fuconolactonase
MKFIDSHIHFLQPTHLRYTWLDELPILNQPVLPADLPAVVNDWELAGFVFVEADCLPEQGLAEAEWVSALAQQDKRIQGIVAFAPLEKPDDARSLLNEYTKLPLVKGIRRLIQSEGAGFSIQPDFVRGVQMVAEYGYRCDLCIRHHQLPDVIELVRQCPDVAFVLDHMGKPDIKNRQIEDWRINLATLAQFPHVQCKISGMVTEADPDHWQPAHLQPYIDHVLAVFGVERVMWGSDSPVLRLAHATYTGWLEVAQAALAHLSMVDQQRIFHDNAQAFYQLNQ